MLIKRTLRIVGGLSALGLLGFPMLSVWMNRHPELAKTLEASGGMVDPDADALTRGRQMVSTYAQAREEVANEASERAADEAYEEAERKRERMRKFNSGESQDEDY